MLLLDGMEGDIGLVAGRSQREKRRSYKDLLREEEEIDAQVRKSSKKRPKDSELFLLGEPHKKKKKHLSEDYLYRKIQRSGLSSHKKKLKYTDESLSLSPSHSTDTAMGLLEAITSPTATGCETSPLLHEKPSYPPSVYSHPSSKDRKRDSGLHSGSKPGHHSSKKHSTKSLVYLSGGHKSRTDPLTLREPDGFRMKLVLSPHKDDVPVTEDFPLPSHSPSSSSPLSPTSSSSIRKDSGKKKDKDREHGLLSKSHKKKHHTRDILPVVGQELELEEHYSGVTGCDSSSTGGELEAGELVIDDSFTHLSKKKKKSKKSKKKKGKEKDREKGRERKHSWEEAARGEITELHSGGHSQSSASHSTGGEFYTVASAVPHHHHRSGESHSEKRKKKEEREKMDKERDKPKKKIMSAYHLFSKEYRVNINAEQPGLVFGELSKKLADVWKRLPEREKQVWRVKAQHIQHKQNKAEATTVRRRSSLSDGDKSKVSDKGGAVLSPSRTPVAAPLSPARVPDVDPIDAAAHLQLLGESLSLIGHRLQETEGMVAVSGSLSVLLDSILCALGPLTCLTAQVPELNSCPRHLLANTLDNLAYVMPGI